MRGEQKVFNLILPNIFTQIKREEHAKVLFSSIKKKRHSALQKLILLVTLTYNTIFALEIWELILQMYVTTYHTHHQGTHAPATNLLGPSTSAVFNSKASS